MSQPLGRLEAAVDRLGRGDLSVRAEEDQGPLEVRTLARQFNRMAGRLNELVEAQRRFVADASHQLRSPLTALRLRIENLEASADSKAPNGIAAVGREVHRMSRLVDGLLTLESASQDQPERAEVMVGDVIRERCEAWAALAAERGIDLVQESGPMPAITCELVPGDLDQVLDNLLANALEVSPDGGRIRVRLTGTYGRPEIHVVDEGPGMSAQDREHAFDRFWQGPERPSGHSGLGLAIVRQLALRNSVSVELRADDGNGLDAVVLLSRA
jgi:signal transduction histidine kinase